VLLGKLNKSVNDVANCDWCVLEECVGGCNPNI